MNSKWKLLLATLLSLALVAAACGGSSSDGGSENEESSGESGSSDSGDETSTDAGSGERGESLTIGTLNYPSTWAVNGSEYGNMAHYYQAAYDGLVRISADGSTIEPWLATEWSWNDDLTVLTMTLRDDVTFHDGTALDAEAAAASLNRFGTGTSPDASNLASMDSAVALDAATLEITLSVQDPAFMNFLARNAGLVQNPASFDSGTESTVPAGSGPYILDADRTVAESTYTFTANPDYWAPETIHYDELVLRPITDPTAMVNAIKAGEINAGNLLSNDVVPEVEAAGWDLHTQELDWVGLTLVDRDGSMGTPLSDVRVRQAINMALDNEAVLNAYGAGYGTVTTQVFNTSSPAFDAALDERYPYDIEAAQALMAEAGYADGFTLQMPSVSALGEAVFAIIADSLADINITVEYTEVAIASFFDEILAPNYPAYFMILEQSANDWQAIKFLVSPDAVWNPSGYTDETASSLIEQIQVAPEDERDALVAELGAHVTEEAWFAPFYRNVAHFATDADTDVTVQIGNAVPYLWLFTPQG